MIKVSTVDDDTACFDIKLHIPICMMCVRNSDCYDFMQDKREFMIACDDFVIVDDDELKDVLAGELEDRYYEHMDADKVEHVLISKREENSK